MAARKLLKIYDLTEDDIFMINFAGRVSDNNPQGHKQFCIILKDEELAAKLKEDGWNIFYTKESEKYGPSKPALPVEIRYHYEEDKKSLNPKVYKCTKKNKTLLTEDLIPDLEADEIINIDLWISPSYWTVRDKSGIKAYVDTMWVTIEEDERVARYDRYDEVEEELPPFEE